MIETPEDYTLLSWLGAEQGWKGPVEVISPAFLPHPNEVATREAVKAGIYTAEDVGVHVLSDKGA